jgi:hypothetical protein
MTMMRKQMAGLVLATSVMGGVGAGVAAHALTSDESVAAGAGSADTTPVADRDAPDGLELAPGRVGPVRAGMTKAQALATGYFAPDRPAEVDGCPALPLAWKDADPMAFDVQTLGNGEITSIGVRARTARTADGLGVGSTYDDVKAVYPDETLTDAGYSQSGIRVFDRQDGGWIGFLFDAAPAAIAGSDPVTFVEVTKGAEPSLMRDGC